MAARAKNGMTLSFWLARIIDDLNPEEFSIRELVREFGDVSDTKMGDKLGNPERYIRSIFAELLTEEYVEKIARGRYRVTQAGEKFRDNTPLYD